MKAGSSGSQGPTLGYERSHLIETAARSVTELQSNVNNLADVMVFLEVLGYTDEEAKKAGVAGMAGLVS